MDRIKWAHRLTTKVVLAWMLMLAISNAIIGTLSYTLYRNDLLDARTLDAQNIASALALRIDGDRFAEVMQSIEKNDFWYEIKEYSDGVAEVYNTAYIYILDAYYTSEVTYFAESSSDDSPYDLGMTELIEDIFDDKMFDTIKTGQPSRTGPYDSGEYGKMVSGFAPVVNSAGSVAGVVGVDLLFGDIQTQLNSFALAMVGIIAAFLVVCYFLMSYLGTLLAGKPLGALDAAARKLSTGDMDVKLDIHSTSEIGRLADSFTRMVTAMSDQARTLEVISQGDLSPQIEPRGEKDTLGKAIVNILNNLNPMFGEINQAAAAVSAGARQIASSAQTMALGANEQALAVDSLQASITDMTAMTKENLEISIKTNNLTGAIKADAQTGSEHMNRMTLAVKDITDASIAISKVIKVIDDIAFQTNILALNANVEAARAGSYGKGFAVVAEEVRNLAKKSADAAKDTERLISDSMEKARYGAKIADETAGSLTRIIDDVNQCATLFSGIAGSFEKQIAVMENINAGIGQVSQVVQRNSESAEQSAQASAEMSAQSDILERLVSSFKLRGAEQKGARGLPPAVSYYDKY